MKKAAVAGGLVWVAPAVDSLTVLAAAASGQVTTEMRKAVSGSANPGLASICANGAVSNQVRGTVTYDRIENPARISFTITLASLQPGFDREVILLQSNALDGCLSPISPPTVIDTWTDADGLGPRTFGPIPILSGANGPATNFVADLAQNGGGSNHDWASLVATLP